MDLYYITIRIAFYFLNVKNYKFWDSCCLGREDVVFCLTGILVRMLDCLFLKLSLHERWRWLRDLRPASQWGSWSEGSVSLLWDSIVWESDINTSPLLSSLPLPLPPQFSQQFSPQFSQQWGNSHSRSDWQLWVVIAWGHLPVAANKVFTGWHRVLKMTL